jgi:hypothetical protein
MMSTRQWANIGDDAGAPHALLARVAGARASRPDRSRSGSSRRESIAAGESTVVVVGAFDDGRPPARVMTARIHHHAQPQGARRPSRQPSMSTAAAATPQSRASFRACCAVSARMPEAPPQDADRRPAWRSGTRSSPTWAAGPCRAAHGGSGADTEQDAVRAGRCRAARCTADAAPARHSTTPQSRTPHRRRRAQDAADAGRRRGTPQRRRRAGRRVAGRCRAPAGTLCLPALSDRYQ